MHKLDTYPFDHPKRKRRRKNTTSELMKGVVGVSLAERWMLQRRNKGMKRTRAIDIERRRFPDQMSMKGKAQTHRPRKSPILKIRKWMALNNSGWKVGLVGCIERVIGGKTDYAGKRELADALWRDIRLRNTYQSDHKDACNCDLIVDIGLRDPKNIRAVFYLTACTRYRSPVTLATQRYFGLFSKRASDTGVQRHTHEVFVREICHNQEHSREEEEDEGRFLLRRTITSVVPWLPDCRGE